MNALRRFTLALSVALSVASAAFSQDQLRGMMTTAFGDLAAIKKNAEAGDARAQVSLADSLASSFHTAEALVWYRKAAAQGNVEGAYQVGRLLLFGCAGIPASQSVKADPSEGIRWTFMAATNLHADACHNMSRALQRGVGVSTNQVEAYAWLQLFADSSRGSIVGRVELNQMALKMDSRDVERAKSLAAQFKAGHWQRPSTKTIPDGDSRLKLGGIMSGGKSPLAVINGKTLAEGESAVFPIQPTPLTIRCLKIEKDAVLVQVQGEDSPRQLRLK